MAAPQGSILTPEPEATSGAHTPKAPPAVAKAPLMDYELPKPVPRAYTDLPTWASGVSRKEFREDLKFESIVPLTKYRSFLPKPRDLREIRETDTVPESYLRQPNPPAIDRPFGFGNDRLAPPVKFSFTVPPLDASTDAWEVSVESMVRDLRASAPRSVANEVTQWALQAFQLRISEAQCYGYCDARLHGFDQALANYLRDQMGTRELFANRLSRLSRECLQAGKHLPSRKLLYMLGASVCRDETSQERLATHRWAGFQLSPSTHGVKSLLLVQVQS
jgi:hypothetical protein